VPVNRRNVHHRPALLWRFCDSGAGYKTADLLIYLMTFHSVTLTTVQFWQNTTLKCMQYSFLFCVYVSKHSFCDFCLQRYFFLENGILTYAKSAAEVCCHVCFVCSCWLLYVVLAANNSGHIVHTDKGASVSIIWQWSKGGNALVSKRILAPTDGESLFFVGL